MYAGKLPIILHFTAWKNKMDWLKLAREIGFEDACILKAGDLIPKNEVREMCSADRCRAYGRNWTCPPACGTVEECAKRIKSCSSGVLVQTVGKLEDSFDGEGIAAAQKIHLSRFSAMVSRVQTLVKDCLPLAAGTCTRCEVCSYPDAPCRNPEKAFSSMEAYGLLVSEVCRKSGMQYYKGENTVSFVSCILFREEQ